MKFLFELQKKENKKTKTFSKVTTADEPEPSVQSKRTRNRPVQAEEMYLVPYLDNLSEKLYLKVIKLSCSMKK